jgi:hypothetical protein
MKTWASLKDALARQVLAVSLLGKIVPAADRISAEIPSYLLIEGRPLSSIGSSMKEGWLKTAGTATGFMS